MSLLNVWVLFSIVVVGFFCGEILDMNRRGFKFYPSLYISSALVTFLMNLVIFLSTTLYIYHSKKTVEIKSEPIIPSFNVKIEEKHQQQPSTTIQQQPNVNITIFNLNIDYHGYDYY
uniref:Uncharacterized protein n=1 Tax=Panagrolaimus sp. PS1159 TaxID=55785 RepID=A0AC35GDN5_9BILA